ncbi:MAG: hypothetical protein WBD20_13790 [Pirellulaceae bacterium]
MGYTGHSGPTPPRSLRVIFGAKIAAVCLFFGATIITQNYHRAASMKEQPTEMQWQQLADDGLPDNSFICLTDVQMSQADQNAFDDFIKNFDEDADPAEMQEQFAAAMEDIDAAETLAMSRSGIKIVPIGVDGDSVRKLVYIPRKEAWLADAEYQLDEYGTLTGHVSSFSGAEFGDAIFALFGFEDPLLKKQLAEAEKVYILEPMRERLDTSQASTNFWMCGLGLSFGLILCCSGGPSIICCVFFMGPSVLSLLGYPMRYGRGGNFTKLVYLCAGGGLAGLGYKYLIVEGQFGHASGNPILHAVGFIALFFGFAAMLSIPCQLTVRKLAASVEPLSKKKHKRLSYEAACSLTPPEPEDHVTVPTYITRAGESQVETLTQTDGRELSELDDAPAGTFVDGMLVQAETMEMPNELQSIADSLTPMGFATSLELQWSIARKLYPAAIQLGCQNMVVSDIQWVDGQAVTRLISVLHDGMAIVTVSRNLQLQSTRRIGTSGYYNVAKTDDPLEMMSLHLEETVAVAEKRDTAVVLIDTCEIQDVCLFGRRVLAEIQSQYGEMDLEVASKKYGRFNVPAKPVVGELVLA